MWQRLTTLEEKGKQKTSEYRNATSFSSFPTPTYSEPQTQQMKPSIAGWEHSTFIHPLWERPQRHYLAILNLVL